MTARRISLYFWQSMARAAGWLCWYAEERAAALTREHLRRRAKA